MPINWKGIKTTGNRFYDANRIAEINDSLQYLPAKQRAAVIGTIIEESGGDPLARSEKGTYQGLLQWGADRYKIQSNDARKELANQLSTLRSTINNTTDKKSWSHGGTGSGYNSFQEAYDTFHDKDAPLEDVYRAFSFGYVRPKGKEASYKNRLEVTKQVYPKVLADDVVKNSAKAVGIIGDLMHMNEWKDGGAINNRPAWDKLSMAERADVMKLAIEGGVYDLDAIRSGYNEYAKGGKIHIDPSKKGTFTAAASKHGMGVQEFASKVLSHPENYSTAMRKKANFARNAAKWKHEDGGNLYAGNNPNGQQMLFGPAYWQQQAQKPIFTEELAEFNKRKVEEGRQRRDRFEKWIDTKGKELVEKRQKDYLTTSNDNTWVENRDPLVRASRPKNPHLTERSVKGAEAHAAWAKAHPYLDAWGTVLGAVPFAVAAYPLVSTVGSGIAALGDAAAATSVGHGITNFLSPIATTSIAGATVPQWLDLGLTSGLGAHGLQTAAEEGGVSPTTALELLPITRVAKPAVEMGYNTAKPAIDYSQQAIKDYQIGRAMKLQSQNMPKVNKAFRSEEWGNFLNTRNGDNYYRIANIEKETAQGYSPKENYFVSHTTPWEEFSGMRGVEDPAIIGENLPIFHNRLYEFPSKTFGTRKSSSWKGILGDTNVDVMGKNHLYYGDTSSGVRGPVRVISDTNADYLGISPYKIGIKNRPLTINGLYDKTPAYEDIYMGNQTVLNGKELQEAIQNSTYNIFDHTPLFFMGKDATPSGITKIIHINK